MIRLSFALMASLIPVLSAAPAWSQSMDHSNMPMMQAQPEPEPEPDTRGEPEAPPATPMDHSSMPGMEMPARPEQDPAGQAPDPESQATGADLVVGDAPAPPAPTQPAADGIYDRSRMARAVEQLAREHGGARYGKVMANIAEFQAGSGEDGFRWDGEAWYGGDLNRLVVKTEGDGDGDGVEEAELQVLYSRAVSPLFDLQAGIRRDFEPAARTYATIGFEGMAPYWFDVEGALFLSDRGDLLTRLEGSYDLRLTRKWILQGRAEVTLSAQDVRESGIGRGLSDAEFALRLRYEVRREFAPYIGVTHDRRFGAAADFARAAGERASNTSLVLGIRAWF